jgi:hypothetical protein
LDQEGVGKLVEMGVKLGRSARPDLEVGICGEHGGDPDSIEWCHIIANAPHRKLVLSDCGRAERLATEHRPVGRKARRDAR